MTRQEYVTHALSALLYESWTRPQVRTLAEAACKAVDEWESAQRLQRALDTIPARRDHTVIEARAYRDGIEDVTNRIEQWAKFWRDE